MQILFVVVCIILLFIWVFNQTLTKEEVEQELTGNIDKENK